MSTVTKSRVHRAHEHRSQRYVHLTVGFLAVIAVSALFWTAIIWMIAAGLGFVLTWVHLASIALAIATPPTCIWAALAVRE